MDAYQTLGVSRDASPEDIKRAYRKLAAQHHPDKGGDTAKFQEIQSAYETLTDPQKRQQHDNPFQGGPHGTHFEFHFGGGGPEDIFQRFFQQGFGNSPFGQRQPRRNKDLRVTISVTLASTLQDQQKTINVQTTKGDRFNVDINIPRGVGNGTTIKYSQLGDNFFETLPRGDLYIVVEVLYNDKFEVQGHHLVSYVEIDAIDAMIGVERTVVGLDDKQFLVKIPKGCQYGTRLSIAGQGLYRMNTNQRGDLIVNVMISIPQLTDDQVAVLKNLK